MTHIFYKEYGTIQISKEVIFNIAAKTASEVNGVVAIATNLAEDIIEKLGKKLFSKGTNVSIDNGKVEIKLDLIVKSNYKICEVAKEVQEKVKNSIELMTNLKVKFININIAGIDIEKEKLTDKSKG